MNCRPRRLGNSLLLYNKELATEGVERAKDALIKDNYDQCGSHEGPLAMQHTWHPRSYHSIKHGAVVKYVEDIYREYPVIAFVSSEEVFGYLGRIITAPEEVCPGCFSNNVRAQKTKSPKYFCNYCKLETDELTIRTIPFFIDDREERFLIGSETTLLFLKSHRAFIKKMPGICYSKNVEN